MLYTLKLVGLNEDEIEFLVTIMEIKGIGMGDASKYVDSMPSILFEGLDAATAQKYKAQFEAVGAVIEVSHTGAVESAPEPTPVAVPQPAPVAAPEPVAAVQPKPVVAPEPVPAVSEDPITQNRTIAAIPIEEPEPEPEPEPLPKPAPVQMPSQSVFQINDPNVTPVSDEIEEPKYDIHGSCPKCGSTFVSAKKSAGLFGGTKIKYVCSACKHKF